MNALSLLFQLHQFLWSLESQRAQRLAWKDAVEARIARKRAEQRAAAQLQAMLDAHPEGQLGLSALNDPAALRDSGLL